MGGFFFLPKLKFNSFSVQTQGIFCRLQNIYIYIPKCWRAQLLFPSFQNRLNTTRKLTANLTFTYKKQYTAPRREYTVSELIFSSSNCCHSPKQVNEPRTPMIYPSVRRSLPLSSRILRGSWHLPQTASFATRSWATYLLRTSLERMGVSRLNVDFMESVEQLS